MKTFKFLMVAAALAVVVSCAQNTPNRYGELGAAVEKDPELAALKPSGAVLDSLSYLFGINVCNSLVGNGFFDDASEIDFSSFKKGFKDAAKAGLPTDYTDTVWAKNFSIEPAEIDRVVRQVMLARRAYHESLNMKLGEKFLEENVENDSVKLTVSGLDELRAAVENDPELAALKPSGAVLDSLSYLFGINVCNTLVGNGFFDGASEIDFSLFRKGFKDAAKAGLPTDYTDTVWAKNFSIEPAKIDRVARQVMLARRAYLENFNKKLGEKFFEENAKKDSVKVTDSGLQYKVLEEGEGALVAAHDTITIKYTGTLLDGTVFDSGVLANRQLIDPRNNRRTVVEGWVEGLALLNKGAKATLYVPGELGYGPMGQGRIEPNATLIFDVEVVDVKPYQAPVEEPETK